MSLHSFSHVFASFPHEKTNKDVISIKNIGGFSLEKAEIYATSGKKIQEINILGSNDNISVTGLSNGVYFLRLYTDQGSLNKKLIIQD